MWHTVSIPFQKGRSTNDPSDKESGADLVHTLTENIQLHRSFHSRHLSVDRDVIVYLPPGYDHDHWRRYPVLYFQDGQNLFDAATAFLGHEWGLDETAEYLIQRGEIAPLIIVGVYNTGVKRISEYTPVRDRRGRGGFARGYGRMIVEDLKPFIDGQYRTYPGHAATGLGGSSLGGLVSLYLGLQYPAVFGKLAIMSPSVWWANRDILQRVRRTKRSPHAKIWLDVGTAEGGSPRTVEHDAYDLKDALVDKGWRLGDDLAFHVDQGGGHDERAWGYRVQHALRFLYPA
jgi:predicted alpha/beta superfamily hydrolase